MTDRGSLKIARASEGLSCGQEEEHPQVCILSLSLGGFTPNHFVVRVFATTSTGKNGEDPLFSQESEGLRTIAFSGQCFRLLSAIATTC